VTRLQTGCGKAPQPLAVMGYPRSALSLSSAALFGVGVAAIEVIAGRFLARDQLDHRRSALFHLASVHVDVIPYLTPFRLHARVAFVAFCPMHIQSDEHKQRDECQSSNPFRRHDRSLLKLWILIIRALLDNRRRGEKNAAGGSTVLAVGSIGRRW
jgi:hypothetical protein